MKIKIDCKYLTNKGNGKKCRIGIKNKNKLPECVFLQNGIPENMPFEEKERHINNLLYWCKKLHERTNELTYFLHNICPQVEKKIGQIYKKSPL
ncbi:MAG: hypothetical protein PHG13_00890 [Candidatus Pacebacteria bacterium]|nr:hypothetical protein [Candidatus Paceibacterota bacterium]MDD5721949.1 hypothetical protein [Candidatus Paceibacterota bacterium]